MKYRITVLTIAISAIAGCSSGPRAPAYDMMAPYRVSLVNSCSYAGKGVVLTDYKPYFTDDIAKSEYETRDQYMARMKGKVPEYITFRAKAGYGQYNAETGTLRVTVTGYGPPQGQQLIDMYEQERQNTAHPVFAIYRDPYSRSFPRVSLGQHIPYTTTLIGQTAYGYEKEFTAARMDQYYASLGMLDSIKSSVDRLHYYAEIPMTGLEAKNAKDDLSIEFTIRTTAPYLLSYKDVIKATITDPYAIARYEHVFVGDYCTSSFVDVKTGKRYDAPLKIDLPYQSQEN